MRESRTKKSLKNAQVNLIFYFITLALSFFSRKIFLDYLGAEFIGLTGTLQNLLGFLNLADLGIGASIGYVLYKPIFEKDEKKINEIISVFGFLYRRIGLIILSAGIILSFFLPLIFKDININLGVVYAVYYGFLASSLIGYFINYKQTLLGADQRNYVVVGYFQTATLIKTLIQMAVAYYSTNYYIWIAIELAFSILFSIILNIKIKQTYPWLKSSITEGKVLYKDYDVILKKAKQMFVHVLSGMGRTQVLPFLIYAYESLTIVAYYGNYTIITSKLSSLVENFLNSTGAGVGNLIAEGNKEKILEVYWELFTIRIITASTTAFMVLTMVNPFIKLWLGEEYILPTIIPILMVINLFMNQTRGAHEQFLYGYGLFQDTWAPLVTLTLTISVGLLGGYIWGLPGVLLGDCISAMFLFVLWKPSFLFKSGFKLPLKFFWINYLQKVISVIICMFISWWLLSFIPINMDSFTSWIVYSIISLILFELLLLSAFYLQFKEMKQIFSRFSNIILKKVY